MSKRAFRPGVTRWLTVGVAVYLGWLAANLFLAVLIPVFFSIEIIGGRAGQRLIHRLCALFLRFFFLGYFSLVKVYHIKELPDAKRLSTLGPCILAANHRSWIDALILTALIPKVRIPVNVEYTRIPLAGRVMRWLGCVPLDRKSRESISAGAAEVRQILNVKTPVAVFPEGTRSSAGHLRPFSSLFFRIAIEENVPVIPILIHTDLPFLGPGYENYLTARCAVLRIRMLDQVMPDNGERGADLGYRIRKQMLSSLAQLDEENPGLRSEGTDE